MAPRKDNLKKDSKFKQNENSAKLADDKFDKVKKLFCLWKRSASI